MELQANSAQVKHPLNAMDVKCERTGRRILLQLHQVMSDHRHFELFHVFVQPFRKIKGGCFTAWSFDELYALFEHLADRETKQTEVEIVGPNGEVHQTRPLLHADVFKALKSKRYSVRRKS